MASSNRVRRSGRARARAAAAAPPAAPELNPEFAAMPAQDLVVFLQRHGLSADFADAARVLASRDRRLAQAEDRLRRRDELRAKLLQEMGHRERQADEAEAQIRRLAAEREKLLREEISALERRAAEAEARAQAQHGSGIDLPAAGTGAGVGSDTAGVEGSAARATTKKARRGGGAVRTSQSHRYTALRMRADPPGPPAGSVRATKARRS